MMNPKRVRDFAKAMGTLAKTDRIDAKVSALFAQKIAPPSAVKPRENQTALQELVNRRRQLIDLQTVEKNHLQTTLSPLSQRNIKAVLKLLDKRIKRIEIEIEKLVQGDDHWRNQAELIQSIPGLGKISTATLVADIPEIGQLNRPQIACSPDSLPSTTTAENPRANAPSRAVVNRSATSSTWPPSPPKNTTP